ncbi:hypothetical protein N0V88_006677 [Collariella sp. IMI 366227]|nr:hypothetical protein N0V88_006677 [Collariella sp. IMI 366227]
MSDGSRTSLSKSTFHFAAGLGSGVLSAVLLQPIDLLKTRVQQSGSAHSLSAALADIRAARASSRPSGAAQSPPPCAPVRYESTLYNYRSLASAARDIAATQGERVLCGVWGDGSEGCARGGFGVVCSVISNPFDAVKTRIQLQPEQYRNMVQGARKMVGEEGVRALWDGLALRMSRKAVSSALAWTVYEELIRRAEASWGGGGGAKVKTSL